MLRVAHFALGTFFATSLIAAQQPSPKPTTAADAANRDTSYIEDNGTVHVTRVVPVPQDLSPEAQKFISRVVPDEAPPVALADRRARMDEGQARAKVEWSKICPNTTALTKEIMAVWTSCSGGSTRFTG